MAIDIPNQGLNDNADLQTIPCIFCGLESDDVVLEEDGYTARKCPRCGLVYLSPRPFPEAVIELYGRDNAHVSAASHLAAGTLKRLYARHHISILNRHVTQGALLEIGAGAGFFLDVARQRGFEVHGIELNPVQRSFIRQALRIPCEDRPLNICSFGDKEFDVIYHCDVISHFHDPFEEFRMIHRKLKPNGLLIFETGNFGDVEGRYYSAYTRFQFPDHLFFYGERNLRELLCRSGFDIVHIYRFSILTQLYAMKCVKVLRNIVRGTRLPVVWICSRIGGIRFSRGMSTEAWRGRPWFGRIRRFLACTYYYTIYIIRYGLGSILPKQGRPLTLIVTARKRRTKVDADEVRAR